MRYLAGWKKNLYFNSHSNPALKPGSTWEFATSTIPNTAMQTAGVWGKYVEPVNQTDYRQVKEKSHPAVLSGLLQKRRNGNGVSPNRAGTMLSITNATELKTCITVSVRAATPCIGMITVWGPKKRGRTAEKLTTNSKGVPRQINVSLRRYCARKNRYEIQKLVQDHVNG